MKRPVLDLQAYVNGVTACDRAVLGRAITLIESNRRDHQRTAQTLLDTLLPRTGKAIRLGVTGVPGVGKSTFVEALGMLLVGQGLRVAVLGIACASHTRVPALSAAAVLCVCV